MVRLFIFLSITLAVEIGFSETSGALRVFDCEKRFSLHDTRFQQGSEFQIFIHLQPDGNLRMDMVQGLTQTSPLFLDSEMQSKNFSSEQSLGVINYEGDRWKTYVSMVYLGNAEWGMVIPIPENFPRLSIEGNELELYCNETQHSDLLF